MATLRLPRFSRASDVRSFRVTERDFEILQQINRHRFLRSSHLCQLLNGSPQQLLRRLQLLYHHGYLERPRAQLDYFHRGGSEPIVYGLGNKGAEWLIREQGGDSRGLNWAWKNQSVGRAFLEHAILTSDILVVLELGRRANGQRLLHSDQLDGPKHTKGGTVQWKVKLAGGRSIGVVPDAFFAIEPLTSGDPDSRSYFFLEADRGTMPIQRTDPSKTSFFRKLQAYHATWKQGLHQRQLSLPRFRVLTITNSVERLQGMIHACHQLASAHGLFLFAEASAFQSSNLSDPIWLDGAGVRSALAN